MGELPGTVPVIRSGTYGLNQVHASTDSMSSHAAIVFPYMWSTASVMSSTGAMGWTHGHQNRQIPSGYGDTRMLSWNSSSAE